MTKRKTSHVHTWKLARKGPDPLHPGWTLYVYKCEFPHCSQKKLESSTTVK